MRQVLDVIGFAAAALAVAATIVSAVQAVVLPRSTQNAIPRLTTAAVRSALRLRVRRAATYEQRDGVMAMLAPAALMLMLVTWLAIIFVAYSVMFLVLTDRSVVAAVELSGSSLVTLGTSSDSRFGASLLSYTEAGLGLLLVALFITYFPSIYAAFTRRETGVTLLQVRAGSPPTATEMLIRYHRIESRRYALTDLWRQWEEWFADVEESHSTFPILVFFRSPQPNRSWITSAGALLDAAAFWVACVDEHDIDPDAQLCLRAGFLTLRRVADAFSIPYDPDPRPDGPITISRQEWDAAVAQMEAAGVPFVADRDQAWRDWRGWRVNYDAPLLRLARLVEAPPTPWVSDRSPVEGGQTGRRPGRRSIWSRRRRRRSRP